jgi:cation:H+ antiporter
MGNIAGAMVLQSTLLPALGIALTPWALDQHAMTSSILALISAAVVFAIFLVRKKLTGPSLLGGLAFYIAFVVLVLKLPA